MRLRAFSITWICGTHGWTATVLFQIHHSSAARVGTHPPAEAVEEESGAGNATKFVNSAVEELNLIARVLALSLKRFIETGTAADWRSIADERTPDNESRPVSLNPRFFDAGITARKVFDKIFKRCDYSASQVVDLIARDREVCEEPGRGQGHKLQPRPIVFNPEQPAEASESKQEPETEATPQSITLSCSYSLAGEVHFSSAQFTEGVVLGEAQVSVIVRICVALHQLVIKQEAATQLPQSAAVMRDFIKVARKNNSVTMLVVRSLMNGTYLPSPPWSEATEPDAVYCRKTATPQVICDLFWVANRPVRAAQLSTQWYLGGCLGSGSAPQFRDQVAHHLALSISGHSHRLQLDGRAVSSCSQFPEIVQAFLDRINRGDIVYFSYNNFGFTRCKGFFQTVNIFMFVIREAQLRNMKSRTGQRVDFFLSVLSHIPWSPVF